MLRDGQVAAFGPRDEVLSALQKAQQQAQQQALQQQIAAEATQPPAGTERA
jgi:ATP-binding cassette subfamily C exporter for protease/lipase